MNLNLHVHNFPNRAKQTRRDRTRELINFYLLTVTMKLTLHLSVILFYLWALCSSKIQPDLCSCLFCSYSLPLIVLSCVSSLYLPWFFFFFLLKPCYSDCAFHFVVAKTCSYLIVCVWCRARLETKVLGCSNLLQGRFRVQVFSVLQNESEAYNLQTSIVLL